MRAKIRILPILLFLLTSVQGNPIAAGLVQDTLVLQAVNPPRWGSNLVLREELRVGSLDGPIEETFGSVDAVVPAPDGSLLIADGLAPSIRRFSETGQFINTLGGPGEGPAEYRAVTGLEVLPDGTVVLIDTRLARIVRMTLEGTEKSTTPILGGFHSIHRTIQVGSDGTVYFNRMIPSSGGASRSRDLEYVWLVYPPDGQRPDTIAPPPEDPSGPGLSLRTSDGTRNPFTVKTLNWMSPDGYLVWARNDEYALNCELDEDGIRQIRFEAEHIPLPNPEWRQWTSILGGMRRGQPRVPNRKPFFRDLWIDVEGRIWVERYVPALHHEYTEEELAALPKGQSLYEWREPTVFDVFEPSGVFLGQVTLPWRTILLYAKGDRIWAAQYGEYDEAYVVRFRVEPGPEVPDVQRHR